MGKDKKDDTARPIGETAVVVVGSLATAAAAAVGVAPIIAPAAALGLGVKYLGAMWARVRDEKAETAYAAFVEQWATVNMMHPEEAAQEVHPLLSEGDPAHDDALYETFRHLAFMRSDRAWSFIARMTAMYVREKRPVDDFFRRAGWLLERCESEDVDIIVKACGDTHAKISMPENRDFRSIRWSAHDEVGIAAYVERGHNLSTTSSSHLLLATTRHGAVVDLIGSSRLARVLAPAQVLFDDKTMLQQVLALFAP